MQAFYEALGLRPFVCLVLHLLLVGYPLRFGLLPLGISSLRETIGSPCRIFQRDCNVHSLDEEQMIQDFGVRFLMSYSVAWFVVLLLITFRQSFAVALHKILLTLHLAVLLLVVFLQDYFHPSPTPEFSASFFREFLVCNAIALALSAWSVLLYPSEPMDSMKWSIPANALFCGAVFNLFLAVGSFQVLWEDKAHLTPVLKLSCVLSSAQTAVLAVLMLRVRYFLTIGQLRRLCLLRCVTNIVLPWMWFPELSPVLSVDERITVVVRVLSTLTYLIGYCFAGQAEGFSSILSSEKED